MVEAVKIDDEHIRTTYFERVSKEQLLERKKLYEKELQEINDMLALFEK